MLRQVIGSSNCLPSGESKKPKILGVRGNINLKYLHIHTIWKLLSAQFYLSFLSLLTYRWRWFPNDHKSFPSVQLSIYASPSIFLLYCMIHSIQYNTSGPTALTFTLTIHEAHRLKNPHDHCWSHILYSIHPKTFSHTPVCRHTHAPHFTLWLTASLSLSDTQTYTVHTHALQTDPEIRGLRGAPDGE